MSAEWMWVLWCLPPKVSGAATVNADVCVWMQNPSMCVCVCVLHYISVFVSFVVLFTRTEMKFLQQFISNIFPQSFHVQGHEDIFFFLPSVEPGNNGSMLPIGAIEDNKWATHNVLMCFIVDKTRRKQSLLLFCFFSSGCDKTAARHGGILKFWNWNLGYPTCLVRSPLNSTEWQQNGDWTPSGAKRIHSSQSVRFHCMRNGGGTEASLNTRFRDTPVLFSALSLH